MDRKEGIFYSNSEFSNSALLIHFSAAEEILTASSYDVVQHLSAPFSFLSNLIIVIYFYANKRKTGFYYHEHKNLRTNFSEILYSATFR